MVYVPNTWVNHFLKDDNLFIAYGGKITQNPASDHLPAYQKYTGWDEGISGNEILCMLKAAEKYSAYDISSFGPQLKEKIRIPVMSLLLPVMILCSVIIASLSNNLLISTACALHKSEYSTFCSFSQEEECKDIRQKNE